MRESGVITDGYRDLIENLASGHGGSRDPTTHVRISPHVSLSVDERKDLVRGGGLFSRFVEVVAKDSTREGVTIADDADGKIRAEADRIGIDALICKALIRARTQGSALIVLFADDGLPLSAPMRPGAAIMSTRILNPAAVHRVDLSAFGDVVAYQINDVLVHASRVVQIDGTDTPQEDRTAGWIADSPLDRVWRQIADWAVASRALAGATLDFSQAVIRIKGLASMLSQDGDGLVLKRLRLIRLAMSSTSIIPLDESEGIEQIAKPISGLPAIVQELARSVSAVTGIPQSKLFGDVAGGMTNGAGDVRHYYDTIAQDQNLYLRDAYAKILNALAGRSVNFSFRSLSTPTEAERAVTRKVVAETDAIYASLDVLSSDEIRKSRFEGSYSPETVV